MTGSVLASIVIPIVVVIVLAGWIVAVLYADRNPGHGGRRANSQHTTVSGGAFEADGGHQVMPHRDATPPEARKYQAEPEAGPQAPRPRLSEPRSPEPRSSEPRSPEPRSSEPRSPEPRAPEPRASEPRSPEPRSAEPGSPEPRPEPQPGRAGRRG